MKNLRSPLLIGALVFISAYCSVESSDKVLHRVRRLINGNPVPEGQPWMAVLAYKNSETLDERPYLIVCGATLIDSRNILAAAHCLDPSITPVREGATLYVVLGLQDNSFGANNNIQEYPIDGIAADPLIHPDFNVGLVFNNDIALIHLSSPVVMSSTVSPLSLPPPSIDESKINKCDFYGWGVTAEPVTDASFTQFLRTTQLRLIKINKCERYYLGFLDEEQHVCASGSSFPCFGDSGSSLICKFKNKRYLTGFNSFRQSGSCDIGTPQAYTKISCYLDWIADNKAS